MNFIEYNEIREHILHNLEIIKLMLDKLNSQKFEYY